MLKAQQAEVAVRPLPYSTLLAALLCVALLSLAGCGGGQGSAQEESEETSTAGVSAAENTDDSGDETTVVETTGGTKMVVEETQPAKPYSVATLPDAQPQSAPTQQVLVDGTEDMSDGPLKENGLVTYYGNPRSAHLGVLGEFADPEAMMERLMQQTAPYSAADPARPAVPPIELIASTAQRDPGDAGSYLGRLETVEVEQYARLAEENGALLLLDVQLGLNTVGR